MTDTLTLAENGRVEMKKTRLRFKQSSTFRCRVEAFASDMRQQAASAQGLDDKKRLLRRAQSADTAIDVDEWLSGNKERPKLLETMLDKFSQGSSRPRTPQQTEDVK